MNPPCEPCRREGGWYVTVAGKRVGSIQASRESIPPFTGLQFAEGRDGQRSTAFWPYEPMCAAHAREVVEKERADQNAAREAERLIQNHATRLDQQGH